MEISYLHDRGSGSKQMLNISKYFVLHLKYNKMKPNFMSNYSACNQMLQIPPLLNLPFTAFLSITSSKRTCWPRLLINQLETTLPAISEFVPFFSSYAHAPVKLVTCVSPIPLSKQCSFECRTYQPHFYLPYSFLEL